MQRDDDTDLNEDVSMFEAAVHAPHLDLDRPALKLVLALLDGSNQDATVRDLAAALAERTGATVAEHAFAEHAGAATTADILHAADTRHADMLVLPVPFGRDIGLLRDESLGSVVDMLLVESKLPVLCVRELLDAGQAKAALAHVVLPMTAADDHATRAAGWALSLLRQGGRLDLLAVADRAAIEEALQLFGKTFATVAHDPEALGRAVSQQLASVVAALQKTGAAQGSAIHVEVKVGRTADVVLAQANPAPHLVVIGTPRDHITPAFHRARDLILGACGPVLVV